MTPYYEADGITIYHGDCRDVLPSLSADVLLTDPPYGFRKAAWDGEFPIEWLEPAGTATRLAAGIMPGVHNLLRLPLAFGGLAYTWTLSCHLTNGMTRGLMGFGNWIPVAVFARDGVSLYRPQQDATGVPVVGDMPDHPSPKPLKAMLWIVSRFPDGSILDPFMGSGTTLVAAKELGRKAVGIEREELYCEVAARRLAQGVLDLGVA